MNPYNVIAIIAFIGLVAHSRKHLLGSVIVAVIWPVLLTMGCYYVGKKYVFKRGGVSEKYFPIEALACILAAAPIVTYLKAPELFRLFF
jgi:hypothetical protein